MTDAPERIWAKESYDSWGSYGHWYLSGAGGGTEYTRADLAAAVTVKPDSIVTERVNPPIPDRSHDWYARFKWADGDTDCYGEGETEESAIIDLLTKAVDYDGDGSEQEEVVELALSAPAPAPDTHPAPEQPSVQDAMIEEVTDTLEEIIGETHDIDVTDRKYAENIVGWLRIHHPAALRALAEQEQSE